MIINIKNETTKDIFNGLNTKSARKIPRIVWGIAQRKLDMINSANELIDLKSPPGNRLEPLKGNLSGFHSIRINDQYRVIFKFSGANASDIKITDYHK
ncbi:type II toxin-antitoxin system RelE/ParE family toxin [bacterium]|nr:type II toxin-antitoxin system RelE/ParE family toxin [bacterium]